MDKNLSSVKSGFYMKNYQHMGMGQVKLQKIVKNGPSKICGRQSFKNLKGHGLLKQAISRQFF